MTKEGFDIGVIFCYFVLSGSKMRISMQLFNENLLFYKFNC